MIYNFVLQTVLAVLKFTRKKEFIQKRLNQNISLEFEEYCWFHCSSVGEINLSETLIMKFLEKTNYKILLSAVTDTGYETAKAKYSSNNRISLIYFPLDNRENIKGIISQIDLKKLILIETEIWPNLINLVSAKSKIYIVNGRISDKSYSSYLKLKFVLKKLFEKIDLFIMQTKEDTIRIQNLGAPQFKIRNYGNLKFDINLPDFSKEELQELIEKHKIGTRSIFTAGSTREDEEEPILEVFTKLENYFLYLVPRHIERCQDIETKLLKNKFKYIKLSELELKTKEIDSDTEILLVDKIGVLRKLYAVCDIAFVGGTLVNIGGHSLLEPLYYEKFPIFGKYTQNVSEIAREVELKHIGFKVESTSEFLESIHKISANEVDKMEIKQFFEENSKAVEKTFDEIMLNYNM